MINWSWKMKMGEITLKQNRGGKCHTFKLNMYCANCLAAVVHEFKEKDEQTGKMKDMYSFYTFWNDTKHLTRCLGLSKEKEFKDNDNIYNTKTEKFAKVKLNTFYWDRDVSAMARLFAKSGIKVELYYKEAKLHG